MPSSGHLESHFTATAAVRDIVIGMADGLTVPFALAAGLTGAAAVAVHGNSLIVLAGLAEIAAGSIAMGLGGYLAAKTDSEHYESERQREIRETVELADQEEEEVAKVFRGYGMSEEQMRPVVNAICSDQTRWVDFMMRFELGLEEPDPRARGTKRGDDCGFLHCRRHDSAGALYAGWADYDRAVGLGERNTGGSVRVWMCERALHRSEAVARRIANGDCGRTSCGCGFFHRAADQPQRGVKMVLGSGYSSIGMLRGIPRFARDDCTGGARLRCSEYFAVPLAIRKSQRPHPSG